MEVKKTKERQRFDWFVHGTWRTQELFERQRNGQRGSPGGRVRDAAAVHRLQRRQQRRPLRRLGLRGLQGASHRFVPLIPLVIGSVLDGLEFPLQWHYSMREKKKRGRGFRSSS